MTKVDFYKKLSDIIEHFNVGVYSNAKAVNLIIELNLEAKESNIELIADPELLSNVVYNEVDEAYEDDDGDDDDWFDDYDDI